MEIRDGETPPAKREREPMAHRIETPDEIQFSINDPVKNIQVLTDKRVLTQNFANLGVAIDDLIFHFKVSRPTVASVQQVKAAKKGRFAKRAYQDRPGFGRKLVRDNLSETRIPKSDKEQFLSLLKQKLAEETKELIEANGQQERIEELGDVFEVTSFLYEVLNISEDSVNNVKDKIYTDRIRDKKRRKLQ
jgi:predicted house-cleaning noncanonical NTP pyrophosphatase (MazG superfamily)